MTDVFVDPTAAPTPTQTQVADDPARDPGVREAAIRFIMWNQEMENIPSDYERVAAAYDRALRNPLVIPE